MANITFLGLGAMGSRMASQLVMEDHTVTVWNRDSQKTDPVRALGAGAASTPADAVATADVVISMVRDDHASKSIWLDDKTGALRAMPKQAVAIECSTLSPNWVNTLSQRFISHGLQFVASPVAGSLNHAENRALIFFVGGEMGVTEKVNPILKLMGHAVHHCGSAVSAAKFKLVVNTLLSTQVALLSEMLAFLKQAQPSNETSLSLKSYVAILETLPVCSAAAQAAAHAIINKQFAPLFPIHLVTKDLDYFCAACEDTNTPSPLASEVNAIFQSAQKRGLGDCNITGLSQLY